MKNDNIFNPTSNIVDNCHVDKATYDQKNLLAPQIYFGIIMEKELIGLNHILRSVTYHIKEMTFI
jgi:hypothetical protein